MLTLYFHPLSSFCHKVLIALYENGTPFAPKLVNLQDEGERAAFRALWPVGKWTSFPRSVKMKKNETVVFSYIVYKSRADRDRCLAKVMKDPRLAKMMDPKNMPFDGKRMIYGGFKVIVEG